MQQGVQFEGGPWTIRVESVDVFADRSMRVNFLVTNQGRQAVIIQRGQAKAIELISDKLERVSAIGRLEGSFYSQDEQTIRLTPQESIRIAIRFPAFPSEAKTVRLIIRPAGLNFGYLNSEVIIPNIALFASQ